MRVFPRYAGKSIAELKAMPRIRSHGTHIFAALAGFAFALENDAVVNELLADSKRDHVKFIANISGEEYAVRCFL